MTLDPGGMIMRLRPVRGQLGIEEVLDDVNGDFLADLLDTI